MEDHRDDSDAAEDLEHQPDDGDADIPEGDALKQAAEVDDRTAEPETVGDAPEADALDQQRPVPGDDEVDDRR